jgi:hypothetical protein
VTVALLGSATQAQATTPLKASTGSAISSSCYGDDCTGLDPVETGCAEDAITWTRMDVFESNANGNLEMRFSAKCEAVWARFSAYDRGWFGDLHRFFVETEFSTYPEAIVPLVWIAGQEAQGFSNGAGGPESFMDFQDQTQWSRMVAGAPENCVALDLYFQQPAEENDLGISTHSEWYEPERTQELCG